jgi:hypothetical protein
MYITAVVVVFQSWGEATRAEDALLAAGYITLILPVTLTSTQMPHGWMCGVQPI